MSISITTINGTDSLAASRITINDNLSTIVDALNDVLSIIDISTGKINNYGFGSDNDMETEDLTVRGSGSSGGLFILSGNANVSNGNVVIGGSTSTGFLQIGGGTNAVYMERISRNLTSGSIPTVNFSGATAGSTGAGTVGYVTLPRLDDAVIKDIQNPTLGSVVYSLTQNALVVCTATGATGTWNPVTLGTAI